MAQNGGSLEFLDGGVEIDASIVAAGLGVTPPLLFQGMRAGTITGRCEQGADADAGRYRLTFFSRHRRFRLVIDNQGAIIQRSSLDFGNSPLPRAAHRQGT